MAPQQGAMTVDQERELLKQQGKYYEQGEGPPLELLGDCWTGQMAWGQSESGHESRCAFVGGDGYFETARVAVESAMCLRFDRNKLPFEGGVMNTVVCNQEFLLGRIINSGIKFFPAGWIPPEECNPPKGALGG